MNERLASAHLTTLMKKENYLMQWINGTGCIVKPGKLYFYEDNNLFSEYEFSLDGVEKPDCCILEG